MERLGVSERDKASRGRCTRLDRRDDGNGSSNEETVEEEADRDFNDSARRWHNSYTLKLTRTDQPLAIRELEFWYVERYQPGYDSYGSTPLKVRMQAGGTLVNVSADDKGIAKVQLPRRFDEIAGPHLSYQLVVRFNVDRADPAYKPYQTPQLELYAHAPLPSVEPE